MSLPTLSLDFTSTNEYLFQPLLTDCSPHQLKQWNTEVRLQEAAITNARHNALNPQDQVDSAFIQEMASTYDKATQSLLTSTQDCKATETVNMPPSPLSVSHEQVITQIGEQFSLNEKQWVAFHIIAEFFIQKYVEKCATELPRLVMLMTGPGGTGKTHVMKAVRAVMEHYRQGHLIRFLAPTGSVAALIDDMTVHKGLGIKIKSSNKGKGNHILGEGLQDYSIIISNQNKTQLREKWKNVEFLLVDETSLLGLQLLAELDHALHFTKEKADLWFGGVFFILSDNFFQYPPVAGSVLYTPISRYAGQTDDEIQKWLGHLSWKKINTMVSLDEQQHMKGDVAYEAAVARLRTHQCMYEDVEMFNSQVIKSANNPDGVDMGSVDNVNAAAIMATNTVQGIFNVEKAHTCHGEQVLVDGDALDKCSH